MTTKTVDPKADGALRLIDNVQDLEHTSLESVRKFVDTVDGAFPDLGDDAPRRKIIDAAFKMVEQLIGASNDAARNVMKVTEEALSEHTSTEAKSKK